MADLIQGIVTTTTGGKDHTPIMVPHIGDITADHSPTPIHTVTETVILEGTLYTLLPATTAACATLQLIDAPVTSCNIVTPHPMLATSPAGATP